MVSRITRLLLLNESMTDDAEISLFDVLYSLLKRDWKGH